MTDVNPILDFSAAEELQAMRRTVFGESIFRESADDETQHWYCIAQTESSKSRIKVADSWEPCETRQTILVRIFPTGGSLPSNRLLAPTLRLLAKEVGEMLKKEDPAESQPSAGENVVIVRPDSPPHDWEAKMANHLTAQGKVHRWATLSQFSCGSAASEATRAANRHGEEDPELEIETTMFLPDISEQVQSELLLKFPEAEVVETNEHTAANCGSA